MAATMTTLLRGLLLWLCCLPAIALAQLPTTLDSDAVMLGDVVELRIDAGTLGEPLDTAPLLVDFSVRSHRQQRMSELRNGRFVSRVQHVLVLAPRRAGNLVVPALAVGDVHSKPLRVQVQLPAGQGAAGSAGTTPDPAIDSTWFVQAELAAPAAYVGQPIGLLVAVYLGQDIASGELILEAPPGASLQRVGQDQNSRVMHNGQPYLKVERRYQLTPERSGTLSLPPARFIGRQLAGLWSGHGTQVQADGPALSLQVRPVPATADTPWLPLQAARLEWTSLPDRLQAGQGARFELEAVLEGGTAAQRDALALPSSGPGWRLYPEPVVMEERQQGARSVVHLRRSFLLVPEQAGSIELPAIQLPCGMPTPDSASWRYCLRSGWWSAVRQTEPPLRRLPLPGRASLGRQPNRLRFSMRLTRRRLQPGVCCGPHWPCCLRWWPPWRCGGSAGGAARPPGRDRPMGRRKPMRTRPCSRPAGWNRHWPRAACRR